MGIPFRHGRRVFYIGFIFLLSLASIWFFGVQLVQIKNTTIEETRAQELKSQNRLLIDTLWGSIDLLKMRALNLKHSTQGMQAGIHLKEAGIYLQAVLQLQGLKPPQVKERMESADLSGLIQVDAFLKSILPRINVARLRETGLTMLRVKQNPLIEAEWLAFVFVDPNQLEEAVLTLTSPQKLFSVVERFAMGSGNSRFRSYVVTTDGLVLAHTRVSYVGSDFRQILGFSEILKKVKSDGEDRGGGRLFSYDKSPVLLSFARIGTLPLIAVLEQVLNPTGLSTILFQWQTLSSHFNFMLPLMIIIFGFFALLTLFIHKREKNKMEVGALEVDFDKSFQEAQLPPVPTLKVQTLPPQFDRIQSRSSLSLGTFPEYRTAEPPEIPTSSPLLDKKLAELAATQETLAHAKETQQLVTEFEQEVFRGRNFDFISKKMTEVVAKLCKSPVLFFAYRSELAACVLKADAGFLPGQAPVAMSFVMTPEFLELIQKSVVEENQNPLTTHYEPLANILMAKTGISHFEAWALTGFGPLGRQSRKVRLVGFLVILQSGVESICNRNFLCHIVRTSGLIYENVLLSQ